MSTTTPTRERLRELQKLGELFSANAELDKLLQVIRDSFIALDVVSAQLKRLEENGDAGLEADQVFELLDEDLRRVDVDRYSLDQAIFHSGQLDQLLDEAHGGLMDALATGEEASDA
jgi:hypothetical protein